MIGNIILSAHTKHKINNFLQDPIKIGKQVSSLITIITKVSISDYGIIMKG